MEGTYSRGSHEHGHFVQARHDKYDEKGRRAARNYYEMLGFTVTDNDVLANGKTDFTKTDLLAVKGNIVLNVEVACKHFDLWRYIGDGVDVETRKLKYTKNGKGLVFMAKSTLAEAVLIPMRALLLAQRDCGDEYEGHKGRKKVQDSANFKMPAHGCRRVRKWCFDEDSGQQTLEDFYRIPYEYVSHLIFEPYSMKKLIPLPEEQWRR